MRTRTVQPEKRVRTRTATQPTLFEEDAEVMSVKVSGNKTALDIMMDLQYSKIPNIYEFSPDCGNYFYYRVNEAIYKRTGITKSEKWIGESVSSLSNFKTCKADPDDCIRLPKKDPLVQVYDFLTNFKKFQDDQSTLWVLQISLFKIENTLKNIYVK